MRFYKKTAIFTCFFMIFSFVYATASEAGVGVAMKIGTGTSCSVGTVSDFSSDWSVNCGGVTARGIAYCGANSSGNVPTGYGDYCWCRLVSPAASDWKIYGGSFDMGLCWKNCAQDCQDYYRDSSVNGDCYAVGDGQEFEKTGCYCHGGREGPAEDTWLEGQEYSIDCSKGCARLCAEGFAFNYEYLRTNLLEKVQ